MPVIRVAIALALAGGLSLFASTASASPERVAFRDAVLSPSAARTTQAVAEWGGPTVATDGETVNIFLSDSYPVDPNLAKQWADFMTGLVHGPELKTVSIHLLTLAEVQQRNVCGTDAYACYLPNTGAIYAPETDPDPVTSARGILIHEYGHHIAASQTNPPFVSETYGTKRWATYEDVCARTQSGTLFPGAEQEPQYKLNPGEAFAESYRVLNEQKLGLPLEAWSIVSTTLYPDAGAMAALQEDVTTPWTADTVTTLSAKLTPKVPTKSFVVETPLDGRLTVKPTQSGKATVSVSLLANTKAVATSSFGSASGRSLSSTVCGLRRYTVRAKLSGKVTPKTKTTVKLTVATP